MALLAALAEIAFAQSSPSQFRSVTDVGQRIPDEHDRPYFRETQSHRGWEIREPQFTVFADTSLADARLAAGHVQRAWQQSSKLADRWTTTHHNPDFALNALQIVISNEPLRDRDGPLTTANVVGIQTQVQINVAPGQPGLEQQVSRLREGAAFGMLHAIGLDAIAPPWVVLGMAAAAGRTGLTDEELRSNTAVARAARFGGQQWRYARSTQDTLDDPLADHEEATSRVAFLLTGEDAQHAPALFAALKQAGDDAGMKAAVGGGFAAFAGDSRRPSTDSAFDRLLSQHSQQYADWKANPQTGLPIFEPQRGASPEVIVAEREMLIVLKLQQRLSVGTAATSRSAAGPKIITFDRTKGAVVNKPDTRRASPATFASLAARLTEASQAVWATLDMDGSLLLSTDVERVNKLLSPSDGRYSLENKEGKSVLVRRLESGQIVRGWLEENPQDKTRPLARFEVLAVKQQPKVISVLNSERQAGSLPH